MQIKKPVLVTGFFRVWLRCIEPEMEEIRPVEWIRPVYQHSLKFAPDQIFRDGAEGVGVSGQRVQ